MSNNILEIFREVKKLYPKIEIVRIYGEIFGGGYPGLKSEPSIQPVQTGIYYSPTIEFYAFDIAVQEPGQSNQVYLNYDKALQVFKTVGILCAEPLFIGKYGECLDFNIHFESTIPAKLKLPPIKGNKAEGVVIKPIEPIYDESGRERVMLKLKIPEFQEDKRFHEGKKWEEKKTFQLSALDLVLYEVDALVTENRLNNAISKIGHVKQGDKEKAKQLLQLFCDDVIDQLKKNCPQELKEITDFEPVKKKLHEEAKKLINQYYTRMWKKK